MHILDLTYSNRMLYVYLTDGDFIGLGKCRVRNV